MVIFFICTSLMSTNNEDMVQPHVESNLFIAKHAGEECEYDLITTVFDIHLC
jgi:hypothetical protein